MAHELPGDNKLMQDYRFGFVTDIAADAFPKGLNEDIVRLISAKKGEPGWMTEWRLAAYRHWLTLREPHWAAALGVRALWRRLGTKKFLALTLTVLLEIHDADSLLGVRSMVGFPRKGYSVLGINNRDLATMQVDLNTTLRLADLLDNKVDLVAESGIKTRADVEKLKTAGISAVLVGQTLCESSDIKAKFRELYD